MLSENDRKILKNPHIKTGDIEIIVNECFIYNKAKPSLIPVEDNAKIYDESKLRWRPIYLRRKDMQVGYHENAEIEIEIENLSLHPTLRSLTLHYGAIVYA